MCLSAMVGAGYQSHTHPDFPRVLGMGISIPMLRQRYSSRVIWWVLGVGFRYQVQYLCSGITCVLCYSTCICTYLYVGACMYLWCMICKYLYVGGCMHLWCCIICKFYKWDSTTNGKMNRICLLKAQGWRPNHNPIVACFFYFQIKHCFAWSAHLVWWMRGWWDCFN